MPTNRRRRLQQRKPGFPNTTEAILADRNMVRHLLTGYGGTHPGVPSRLETREEFAAAWNLVRDELLPAFIAEHPGRRPLAWWIVDHGHERPILPDGLPSGVTEACLRGDDSRRGEKRFGFMHTRMVPPLQELEIDYLDRMGLLEFGEMERWEAAERAEYARLGLHFDDEQGAAE
jgi:hypothetical protein